MKEGQNRYPGDVNEGPSRFESILTSLRVREMIAGSSSLHHGAKALTLETFCGLFSSGVITEDIRLRIGLGLITGLLGAVDVDKTRINIKNYRYYKREKRALQQESQAPDKIDFSSSQG